MKSNFEKIEREILEKARNNEKMRKEIEGKMEEITSVGEDEKKMVYYLLQIVDNLNFMENLLEKHNLSDGGNIHE